jgi:2-oxoglutarate ferredoxin oxidoreductase subunit alpha
MTPVMILTDGYIANAAEPWKVPDMSSYAPFPVRFHTELPAEGEKFLPYARDEKLKRPWVKPGTPGLLHRIGGIEKALGTGNIDYSPGNHQAMTDIRRDKVLGIDVPDQVVEQGQEGGKLVVIGWGSTYGPIASAVRRARAKGQDVSHVHIRHIWPLPKNLGNLLASYEHILVHRPAQDRAARPVSRQRGAAQQGVGPALHHRRDRRRDRAPSGQRPR